MTKIYKSKHIYRKKNRCKPEEKEGTKKYRVKYVFGPYILPFFDK